ncbi:hypothetical protein [uncultured Bifidobacterium sp.]|uniref:hypothetical protein n=1 Tax=uncultured Bifidobacterium sp. TaxID=165187 RepID=UPI00258AACB8|nr:hypothetical protein [uncultured Bifidobacterium sp.]
MRGVVADDGSRGIWVVATVTNLRDVLTEDGFEVSGRLLKNIGLQIPPLWPMQAIVLDIREAR